MTNKEYIDAKKIKYYESLGISVDFIEECDDEETRNEWLARLNQIRSGLMMGFLHSDIDLYADLDTYIAREFVKNCILEQIPHEIIKNVSSYENIEDMKKAKSEYYKSDYIVNNINSKMNTIRGVVDDCEQKFEVFEKYLDTFSEQIEKKDTEIKELRQKNHQLQEKLNIALENISTLKLKKAEDEQTERKIVVTKVIENPKITTEPELPEETKKKSIFSHIKKTPEKKTKDKEPKYIKSSVTKTITDIDSYIINAQLSSEQLLEISKAFTLDITDEQIL